MSKSRSGARCKDNPSFNADVAEIRTKDNNLIKQALTESGDQDFKYLAPG